MRSCSHLPFALALATFTVAALCAGTALAEVIPVQGSTGEAGIALRSQGVDGVEIHYEMGQFAMEPLTIEGVACQKLILPGNFLPNNAGAPDLPGISRYIALPQGAVANLQVTALHTQVFQDVEISPAPVIPRDTEDEMIYRWNAEIYERDAFYPQTAVRVSEPTQIRGVDAVIVGITPFRYNPVTKELMVYTELDIRVDFGGGNGHFGEDALRSRYWEPILANHLLNYESLAPINFDAPPRPDRYGYEYVIITPDDPDFVAWADTLKTWRIQQGISTEVFTLTDVGGTTTTAIENWLNDAYNTWEQPPVAFLLLGDFPNSGNRDVGIPSPIYSTYYPCASDNIYADVVGTDHLPEMVHARITARDAADLETMIGKILEYERAPYTDPGFYNHPIMAGGWQTERWFILCTEVIYGFQANVLGKDPVREYAIYSGSPSGSWSSNPNTHMIVDYFGPSGLGYIPSTPDHLDDWGGNATRLNNDINAGAYLLMHRDHGGETGWGEPNYSIGSLSGLSNEMLPFVLSINCLTGKYNWSSECFTEAFHRMSQGAVGLIAASETSYSFVNDTFVWGMFDGLWPDFMPDYGLRDVGPENLLPCFGMITGKYFLQGSNWPYNPSEKDETHHLFHHHGDVFQPLYSEVPQYLNVIHDGILFTDVDVYTVQADEGAMIALTVGNEIIGVAEAIGAPQDISIIPQSEPGTMLLTVTKANYYRHGEEVPILPPDGPYIVLGEKTIDDTELGNGDGDCDAGETVELLLSLRNVGTDPATNVRATISCEDLYCEILDDYDTYGDIPAGGEVPCEGSYAFSIAADCPDGHRLDFSVAVESDDRLTWEKHFSLDVEAPVIELLGYVVNDTGGGNGNGRIEPGETFTLTTTLSNTGGEDATGGLVYLWISAADVTVDQGEAALPLLPAGGEGTPFPAFQVTVGPDFPDPNTLEVNIAVRADFGQEADLSFGLPVGGFFDDMENGEGLWTTYIVTDPGFVNDWHYSSQRNYTPGGMYSWKHGAVGAGDYSSLADGALESEPVVLRAESTLRFRHWMEAEASGAYPDYCYDGGMVEISINGGVWEQIVPVGGYPYKIREGGTPGPWPAETEVYSGNIDWAEATFEITGYEGEAVFRFRFGSDGADTREGWYVDDVEFFGTLGGISDGEEPIQLTLHPSLGQNQPNPFGPSTVIAYRLPSQADVMLRVYDPAGRLVRTLVDGTATPGTHLIRWDGRNDAGAAVGSGVYFYRFDTEGVSETKKMIVTR